MNHTPIIEQLQRWADDLSRGRLKSPEEYEAVSWRVEHGLREVAADLTREDEASE